MEKGSYGLQARRKNRAAEEPCAPTEMGGNGERTACSCHAPCRGAPRVTARLPGRLCVVQRLVLCTLSKEYLISQNVFLQVCFLFLLGSVVIES